MIAIGLKTVQNRHLSPVRSSNLESEDEREMLTYQNSPATLPAAYDLQERNFSNHRRGGSQLRGKQSEEKKRKSPKKKNHLAYLQSKVMSMTYEKNNTKKIFRIPNRQKINVLTNVQVKSCPRKCACLCDKKSTSNRRLHASDRRKNTTAKASFETRKATV